jgi:hypothetical protein
MERTAQRDALTRPREALSHDSNTSSSSTCLMGLVLGSFLVVTVVECVTSRVGLAACHGSDQQQGKQIRGPAFVPSRVTESDVVDTKVGKLSGQM